MGAMQALAIRVAAFALALGAIACGEPDASGTWSGVGSGTGTAATGSVAVTFKLTENDDAVSGSGTASGRGGSATLNVAGSAKDDSVDLTITAAGFGAASRYRATFDDDDTMVGTWTEPGFTMALTLNRQ
jgi:hypothetical protein